MEVNLLEPAIEQLKESSKILIALAKYPSQDSIASGAALVDFLTSQGKEVVLASSGSLPSSLAFLNKEITHSLSGLIQKQLVIKLNTQVAKLGELNYETKSDSVEIYISPESGIFQEADVEVITQHTGFSSIVTLGVSALEDLGELYSDNTDLFFNTPVINIDVASTNEYFGAFNLVNVTSISLSQEVYELIRAFSPEKISSQQATALLTGIIAKTHSFQDVRTSPSAFTVSAELMELGGNHQEVIQHLFKTKSLNLLKAWGRALARLKTTDMQGVLFSCLFKNDLEKIQFKEGETTPEAILSELLDNISGFKVVVLFIEKEKLTEAYIALHPQVSFEQLNLHLKTEDFQTTASNFYSLVKTTFPEATYSQVEARITQAIKIITA